METDRLARALTAVCLVALVGVTMTFIPGAAEAQNYVETYCEGRWVDYLHNGVPLRDYETHTNVSSPGQSNDETVSPGQLPSGFSDIASGYFQGCSDCNPPIPPAGGPTWCNPSVTCVGPECGCGEAASVGYSYFEGDGVSTTDHLCMRMAVDAVPTQGGSLANSHWNFLIDVGQAGDPDPMTGNLTGGRGPTVDNYKEFWIDLNGRKDGNPPAPYNPCDGCVAILYQDNASQLMPAPLKIQQYGNTHWRYVPRTGYYDNATSKNSVKLEYWVEVVFPVSDLRTHPYTAQGEQMVLSSTDPMVFLYSTGTSNVNPLQTDWINCPIDDTPCTTGQTTPVTLAAFASEPARGGIRVEWWTATEAGNAGFDLWAETSEGAVKVNPELIPSSETDSLAPNRYSYLVQISDVRGLSLVDADLSGERKTHGPFEVGKSYGRVPTPEPVNWSAIRAEHDRKTAKRSGAVLAGVPGRVVEAAAVTAKAGSSKTAQPLVDLGVVAEGLYRVTSEQLASAGVDLSVADPASIALTNQGQPVAIRVETGRGGGFGPGAYLEFYAVGVDTLYTRTNVYQLWLDRRQALRVRVDAAPPTGGPAEHYREQLVVENDRGYSFSAPVADPWFDTRMTAYTSPRSWTFGFDVDQLGGGEGTLTVELWGSSGYVQTPDHHVQALVNGQLVADVLFDGITASTVDAVVPEGVLQEGANVLELRLPGDTGAERDVVVLDRFSVTYDRATVARDGRLGFDSADRVLTVGGLPSPDVVVYRVDRQGVTRLDRVVVAPGAPYSATFRGVSQGSARFFVSTLGSLRAPTLTPVPVWEDLYSGEAEYLVISHPDFLEGIQPLVAARRADGLTVKVVDVEQLLSQLGHGVFDPQAVKDYIAAAADRLGTRAVLLVGGDTYDYLDVLQLGSVSFIPTLYAPTHVVVSFAPADALFGDVDGDGVQDLAIGRFPVRTEAELEAIVTKTLAYPEAGHAGSAVFAADDRDGSLSFAAISETLISSIGPSWSVERAYIDELGASGARSALLDALNRGVALVDFFGHSGPSTWTFDGLLSASDAPALTNTGRPSVVTQWGCWNTYFVDPRYNTLGHKLMLSGEQGAAAVLGAASLTLADSDQAIGPLILKGIVEPGTPVGQAIVDAKQRIGANPMLRDVLVGWMLLGDPMLVVEP